MKIWEKCNELKGTSVSREQIKNWSINNRICPLMFDVGLEIDYLLDKHGYPVEDNPLHKAALKACDGECGKRQCLDKFLDMEYSE